MIEFIEQSLPVCSTTAAFVYSLNAINLHVSGGLENLFHMTKEKRFELRVDMEDFDGNKVYSHYSSFHVGPESGGYILEVEDFRNGGAGE